MAPTPLRNSLLELYGLSALIDERLSGDVNAFRAQYASVGKGEHGVRRRALVRTLHRGTWSANGVSSVCTTH